MNTAAPPVIEGLEIVRLIGQGEFGAVFQAEHKLLERTVAVKVLIPAACTGEQALQRFQREAKITGRLNHPNIAGVYSYGVSEDGRPYLVMEYLEGKTLSDWLKEKPELNRLLEIFLQVCSALAHAHSSGITHRDLKPGNIFVTGNTGSENARLLDFGIAKFIEADEKSPMQLTANGEILGSPVYMSPEQCGGEPLTAASDLYSLGCIMFESLTGQVPFSGNTALEVMLKHKTDPVPLLSEKAPHIKIPISLTRLVRKCLSKNPSDRPASAAEIATILSKAKEERSVELNARNEQVESRPRTPAYQYWLAGLSTIAGLIMYGLPHVTMNRSEENAPAIHVNRITSSKPRANQHEPELSTSELFDRAEEKFRQGKLVEAASTYSSVLKQLSNKASRDSDTDEDAQKQSILLKLAQCYARDYQYKESEQALLKVKELSRDDFQLAKFNMVAAELHCDEEKLAEAGTEARKAIKYFQTLGEEGNTKLAHTTMLLGQIYFKQSRYAEAVDTLKKAVNLGISAAGETDNITIWARSRLCLALYMKGEHESSLETARILSRDMHSWAVPTSAEYLLINEQLIEFYLKNEEYALCRELAERLVNHLKQDPQASADQVETAKRLLDTSRANSRKLKKETQ